MTAPALTRTPSVQAQALPAQQQGAAKRGDLQRTAVVAAPPAPTQPTVASTEAKKTTQGPIIMNGQVRHQFSSEPCHAAYGRHNVTQAHDSKPSEAPVAG